MLPAKEWPPRMSFDAIRIPLYLSGPIRKAPCCAVEGLDAELPRLQTPAWINVSTNEVAPWYMAGGLLAVRDLTLGEPQEAPQIDDKDDYYSASLKLLVWLAKQDQR
jgi:endoglucanase